MKRRTTDTNKNVNVWRRMLLLLATLITAVAVAVTCAVTIDFDKPVNTGEATQGQVETSATKPLTSAGTYNYTAANALLNNDIITMAYCGGIYAVVLPQGTYKLEVWGARGGQQGGTPGYGGYSYGQIVFSGTTTVYVVCGGIGTNGGSTNSTLAGGYNGGGAGIYMGSSGGGATHMATSTGVLSSLSSNTAAVLIVGGGGGGSQNRAGGGGGGGNVNGNPCPSTSYGSGGCGGGTGGAHGSPVNSHNTTTNAGSFGQGGAAAKGGDGNGGGGGGGGWYGGCGATSDGSQVDDLGGGGGSGYIKSTLTSTGGTSNNNNGAGKAQITAISVNQPPTTNNAVITLAGARGATATTSITTSQIATDPDTNKTALHFTDGTSGSLGTFTGTANTRLWIDSSCATLATNYLSWSWSGTQTLIINGYKRYPRSGKDGATANGDLVLYAKVRDTFGSATQYAMSVIKFTVRFPKNTIALTSSGTNFVIGSSNLTTAPDNPAEATGIYNPNGTGKNTLFITKPLVIDQAHTTITAASLVTGLAITAGYDQAVISIDSTTNITGSARKYKVNEVDAASNKITGYTAGLGAIPNAYTQLTLQCVSPDPNYQVLPITLYAVEKTTAYGTANPNTVADVATIALQIVFKMENTRPILKGGQSNIVDLNVNETRSLSLDTFFYDEDAKSTGITASTHSILGVILPANEFVLINKQKKVIAPSNPNTGYYNVGKTAGATESGDAFTTTAQNSAVATGFADKQHVVYNATAPVAGTSREQAFMSFTYSGITLTVTGHRSSFSQYTASRASTAPGHFYLLLHIRDNRDVADNGIWLPIAFTVGKNTNHTPQTTLTYDATSTSFTGQSKVTAYPLAAGSTGQSFYFAPMAVSASGMHVIGLRDGDGGALTAADLQPLALDGDNFTTATGTNSATGKLNELVRLSDRTPAMLRNIVKSVCGDPDNAANLDYFHEGNEDGVDYAENQYFRVEFINIYYLSSMFATSTFSGGRVVLASGTPDVYGYTYTTLDGPVEKNGQQYYVDKGIKITLKSATMNRYLYANVTLTDTTNKAVSGGANIAIRVKNTAPTAFATGDDHIVLYGDRTLSDAYSEYVYDPAGAAVPTFTYHLPLGASVIITPYDFAFDTQLGDGMRAVNVQQIANGFTLNGFNGSFNATAGEYKINGVAGAGEEEINGLFDRTYASSEYLGQITAMLAAANRTNSVKAVSSVANGTTYGVGIGAGSMYNDKLFFMRNTRSTDAFTFNPTTFNDISVSGSNLSGYISQATGNKITVGDTSYNVDFVKFTALSRTNTPAIITLSICDRYDDSSDCTASFAVRIVLEVVNTKPHIANPSYYKELAASPIYAADGSTVVTESTYIFAADGREGNGLMADHDNDEPEFIAGLGVRIANTRAMANIVNIESFDDENIQQSWFTDADGNPLTDYLTAEIISGKNLSVTAISSTKAIATGVFVYFFVTDHDGGTSIGYVQVEVINSAPRLNTSDADGFDAANPLWSIISTSEADIQRARYIIGAESTKELLQAYDTTATDEDIKLLATDDDGRQSKVVLSQTQEDTINGYKYINLDLTSSLSIREIFELAVPSVKMTGGTDYKGTPASVVVYTRSTSGGISAGAPTGNYRAELLFYINDAWISRTNLINKLSTDFTKESPLSDMSDYFDEAGRFIVSDWALALQSTTGFNQSDRCAIRISVRDQAELGGDTAGQKTAYDTNRDKKNGDVVDNRADVAGKLDVTLYQYISQTGIVSINDFLGKNNNYYTVEYSDSSVHTYVPTYDGDRTSTYREGDNTDDIKYVENGSERQLVYKGDSRYAEATTIKVRSSDGDPLADGTLAGTNAGVEYTGATVAGAFRYSDVIEIPSEVKSRLSSDNEHAEYAPVYVPMSYFGLMQTLATAAVSTENGIELGSVVYPKQYVGYAVNGRFGLGDISDFASALTISDGRTNWTGSTLANNPYVNIEAFYSTGGDNSAHYFLDDEYSAYSRPYYNNRLAVRTIDSEGNLYGYEKVQANTANFIGDGKLMYLEEQSAKLKEHNFGLVFTKKHERTGVSNITLTINLAKSEGDQNVAPNREAGESEEDITRSVTVKIHIQNSPIDLYDDASATARNIVKYEETSETGGTYYIDVEMSSTESKNIALLRKSKATGAVESLRNYDNAIKIPYFDDDYSDESHRDYAYFSSDSFKRLGGWNLGASAYSRVADIGSDDMYTYTSKFDVGVASAASNRYKAQKSIAHYFGKETVSAEAMSDIDGNYKPNPGKYGDDNAGYSSYFAASLLVDGRVLAITPLRKTYINQFALVSDLNTNTPTPQQVIAYYKERGLVAEYPEGTSLTTPSADALTPSRVYYPFKMLIYDSCGLDFADASFVALEIRITINNGAPSLKNVGTEVTDGSHLGREFTLNLAVGNTITVNLYDIVYDPDIYTIGGNGLYTLATRLQFESEARGIDRETGDYLESPFKLSFPAYQANSAVRVETATGYKYYRDGGGFSERGSKERDVIMFMDVDPESPAGERIPASNNISFTVNRRTTGTYQDESGVSQSITINEYRFTLRFRDGDTSGPYTDNFTFIINITNQAPLLTAEERSFTMRSGDDLTVLAAYYDVFNGTAGNMQTAYSFSTTASVLSARVNDPAYRAGLTGDGSNNATRSAYWKFPDITSNLYANNIITSTIGNENRNVHLGYLGLADDDTPWRLRIIDIEPKVSDKLWIDFNQNIIKLREEGGTSERNVAVHIRALSACVNEPVTITLADGEGGVITCTLYFTIISSPPVALDPSDPNESILFTDGVEGVLQNNAYVPDTFRLFTVASEEGGQFDIQGVGVHSARKVYEIGLNTLATDPDGDAEVAAMSLYQDGQFTVNGTRLTRDSLGKYYSDYFYIEAITVGGFNGFRLTATGYNPDSLNGYEELTLRIADAGNGDYANTLLITIRVYTCYSDITNPTVGRKTEAQYESYLEAPDYVHVKSYDAYYVTGTAMSAASRYAFVSLTGNTGTDGNTLSPIVDPDAVRTGEQSYTVRLYALFDIGTDGRITALDAETLDEMFTRSASGTFKLGSGDYAQYMIGGRRSDGSPLSVSDTARARLSAVNGFVSFTFENDGAAIDFVPVASTLGSDNVLLYVEVEKHMGTRQVYLRNNAVLNAGSLFRLDVADSAPIAVSGTHAGEGKIGDVISFKIFDAANPYSALFVDSDARDLVTIDALGDDDYEDALAGNSDLDWEANGAKPRAITITVDENNYVNIRINRRIDKIVDDVYLPSVTFNVKLTGHDIVGLEDETILTITIHNTDITAGESSINYDEETGVGYEYSVTPDGRCTLDVSVTSSHPLDIDVSAFVTDPDYITESADTDSFRYTNVLQDISPYKALTDREMVVKWYEPNADGTPNPDISMDIATVEPLGDLTHRTGIRVAALASVRSLTATFYLRIVDRAADPEEETSGVLVRVNITVLNDAPYVLDGMQSQTVYMTGSDRSAPKGMLFYIGDFVSDHNSSDVVGDDASVNSDTYLRIFRQGTQPVESLYSKIYSQWNDGKDDDMRANSSSLFLVSVPDVIDTELLQAYCDARELSYDYKDNTNAYKQWFVVTPLMGFYGVGAIDIEVADGDISTQYDSRTTTFRINVHVIYDANETASAMEAQTIACSKTKTIDIATLMPEIENNLDYINDSGAADTFNQATYYNIVSITFQNDSDSSLVELNRIGESSTWSMKAGNQITIDPVRINVRIAAINNPDKLISKHFMLTIIPNEAPTMRYSEITFRSIHGDEPDSLRDLTGGSIKLEAWQLFDDPDDPQGTALRLVSVKSQVSSLVQVSLEADENGVNRYVVITFVGKGQSQITIGVTDETGNVVELSFLARNDDLPAPNLWIRIAASFEANKVLWAVMIGCVVLLLIILIIIITVIMKKRRAREELEALLVSEMEIEEQMLKLAGGPSPTDYQTYGYLSANEHPTQTMLDPGQAGMGMTALPPTPDAAMASGTALPPPDAGMMPPPGGMPDGGMMPPPGSMPPPAGGSF